jgi:hypothetical protein
MPTLKNLTNPPPAGSSYATKAICLSNAGGLPCIKVNGRWYGWNGNVTIPKLFGAILSKDTISPLKVVGLVIAVAHENTTGSPVTCTIKSVT